MDNDGFRKNGVIQFGVKNILKGGVGGSDSRSVSAVETGNSCRFTIKTRHYRIKRCFIMGKDENTGFSLCPGK